MCGCRAGLGHAVVPQCARRLPFARWQGLGYFLQQEALVVLSAVTTDLGWVHRVKEWGRRDRFAAKVGVVWIGSRGSEA